VSVVNHFERYDTEHPDYPLELARLTQPPPFTATGPLPRLRAVAIVGSREPLHEAAVFANELASDLARAGIAIVSGGARGIDAAAHRGALEAGGATWVVCPTGKDHVSPEEHRELFDEIAMSPRGRLIWPFEDHMKATRDNYRRRNGILVALAEAVVVIQAGLQSGSRNACTWARQLEKSLWVVAGPP
jgi:DNA processing protein